MRKTAVLLTVLGLGVAALFSATSIAPAQDGTSGTVTLESTSIAIGVGVSWGDGVLEYRGKKYPFTLKGLSVVDLGVSKVTARGVVQNLKTSGRLQRELHSSGGRGSGRRRGGSSGAQESERRRDDADRDGTGHQVRACLVAGVDVKLKQ